MPRSCCRVQSTNCNVGVETNSTTIYGQGCVEGGKGLLEDNVWLVALVGMVVGAVQVFGVIASLCLCKSFHDENRVRGI